MEPEELDWLVNSVVNVLLQVYSSEWEKVLEEGEERKCEYMGGNDIFGAKNQNWFTIHMMGMRDLEMRQEKY